MQQDKKVKAQAKLEALLLEGIDSEGQEVTPEYWHNLRSVVMGENSWERSPKIDTGIFILVESA